MRETSPEPGFIQAYRLFVVIRILFWLALGPALFVFQLVGDPGLTPDQAASMRLVRQVSLPNIAPLLLVEGLLLALLLLPRAPERLRWGFVPLTLGLGLLPLLVGFYWWPAENPLQSPFVMLFFVTALLIAWEYKYRYVFLYVFALTLYEAWVSPWPASVSLSVPISWLVLQAAMMLLAGYVTATLVSVQRAQRVALAEAYQRQAAANQQLQQHAATLEELATSRERNRLARELHDTLAHSLSAVTVQLEAVRAVWKAQPEKAQRILEQADETARTGLAEARRALQALRASPLEDLGLVLAVGELAEDAARRSGARLDLRLPDRLLRRPAPDAEQAIYRVAQEMLENTVRHACAGSIRVDLQETDGRLILAVEDDGLGIDGDELPEAGAPAGEHLGIRGMHEWARLIGGTLAISSPAGRGTRIELVVPIERQGHGERVDL